jgi:hypothetical protein
MSKNEFQTESPEVIEPAIDLSQFPIVAEGSGKTAANEGAQAKTVYNVSPVLQRLFAAFHC